MEGVTLEPAYSEHQGRPRPSTSLQGSGLQPNPTSQRKLKPKSTLSRSKETHISLLAASGILLHLALRYGLHTRAALWSAPLYATLVLGGIPLILDLARKAIRVEFGSDLLAGASILTSVALGEYLVGSIVVLMLAGGAALENYATRRASSVLEALARRMPQTAHRKRVDEFIDITLDEVTVG